MLPNEDADDVQYSEDPDDVNGKQEEEAMQDRKCLKAYWLMASGFFWLAFHDAGLSTDR